MRLFHATRERGQSHQKCALACNIKPRLEGGVSCEGFVQGKSGSRRKSVGHLRIDAGVMVLGGELGRIKTT